MVEFEHKYERITILGKHTIFTTMALTFVWIILMEGFSWQNFAVGLLVANLSNHFMGKFFNFEEVKNVNFYKLVTYPMWLICRMYADAIKLTYLVLTNSSKWGILKYKLSLQNEALRIIAADSVTLTPGSVCLERNEENMILLSIDSKNAKGFPSSAKDLISIEKRLLRSEQKSVDEEVYIKEGTNL